MDIGNSETEVVKLDEQPAEAVAVEAEEIVTPHDENTESDDIIIEVDDSPEQLKESNHSAEERKQFAIAQERKRKLEKSRERAEAAEKRNEELEKRLALLEQAQQESKKPTMESCDYDADLYAQKLEEHYTGISKQEPSKVESAKVSPVVELDSNADFDSMKSIQSLNKNVKDFDESTAALLGKVDNLGVDSTAWNNNIKTLCSQAGIDYAKAMYGLSKFTEQGFNDLGETTNQFQVVNVLKKYASRVKIQKRKPITTTPEPSVSSSGTADPKQVKLDAALKAYREDPSNAEKGRLYQRLRAGLEG